MNKSKFSGTKLDDLLFSEDNIMICKKCNKKMKYNDALFCEKCGWDFCEKCFKKHKCEDLEKDHLNGWNYRVVEVNHPTAGRFYCIKEVYYDNKNNPKMQTVEAMAPYGETLEEIKECVEMMKASFNKPILRENKKGFIIKGQK